MICECADNATLMNLLTVDKTWYPSALRSMYKRGITLNDNNRYKLEKHLSRPMKIQGAWVRDFRCYIHGLCEADDHLIKAVMNRYTNLRKIKIGSCEHITGFVNFKAAKLKGLDRIEVHDCVIENLSQLDMACTDIEIILTNCDVEGIDFTTFLRKSSSIKALKCDSTFIDMDMAIFNETFAAKNLSNLKTLVIPWMDVDRSTFDSIVTQASEIEQLAIGSKHLSETDISKIWKLSKLSYLELTDLEIKRTSFTGIESAKSLNQLRIEFYDIEDIHLNQIARSSTIKILEFKDCMLPEPDVIGESLAQMKCLAELRCDCGDIEQRWLVDGDETNTIMSYMSRGVHVITDFGEEYATTETETDSDYEYSESDDTEDDYSDEESEESEETEDSDEGSEDTDSDYDSLDGDGHSTDRSDISDTEFDGY